MLLAFALHSSRVTGVGQQLWHLHADARRRPRRHCVHHPSIRGRRACGVGWRGEGSRRASRGGACTRARCRRPVPVEHYLYIASCVMLCVGGRRGRGRVPVLPYRRTAYHSPMDLMASLRPHAAPQQVALQAGAGAHQEGGGDWTCVGPCARVRGLVAVLGSWWAVAAAAAAAQHCLHLV